MMKSMKKSRMLCLAGILAGTVNISEAAAQVFTPTFQPPLGRGNVGVYLSDFEQGGLAVEGIFRQGGRPYDLGFRIGIADVEDAAFLLGADLRNPLQLGTAPLDIAFTAGGQALLGERDGFGFQAGLSVGSTFGADGFLFTPYIHPRIALVDDYRPTDDELQLDVLADVGVDVAFPNFILRFGVNLGKFADWGIGVALR